MTAPDWTPRTRDIELRSGPEAEPRTVTEIECRACRGEGAKTVGERMGTAIPERVCDESVHHGRRGWLRRHGYEDQHIAPCDGCNGIGWIRTTRRIEA